MEILFALQDLCDDNPPGMLVSCTKVSNVWHSYFHCGTSEQPAEQTVELYVILEALVLMWGHCNGQLEVYGSHNIITLSVGPMHQSKFGRLCALKCSNGKHQMIISIRNADSRVKIILFQDL